MANISFARANGRFFGRFLSGLILNIGFIMAAFTEKSRHCMTFWQLPGGER
jgi:hypothetical protein